MSFLTMIHVFVSGNILNAMMKRRLNDLKQDRAKTEMVAECVRLNGAGEKIATSTGKGVDALFNRLVTWVDTKSLRTNEECTAFMLLNNITTEGIERHQSQPATPQDIKEAKATATTMWKGMTELQLRTELTRLKEASEQVKDGIVGNAKKAYLKRLTDWSKKMKLHTTGDVHHYKSLCNISD